MKGSTTRFSFVLFATALALLFGPLAASAANVILIVEDGPNEGFNDPVLGADRLAAAQAAADAWGATLISNVNIRMSVNMDPDFCDPMVGAVLGSAGTTFVFRNFNNNVRANTWHHSALADARSGQNQNPGTPDIAANFNSDIDTACLGPGTGWCYDVPPAPGVPSCNGPGELDFYTTFLHEVGHGIGMATFVNQDTGQFFMGSSDVYLDNLIDNNNGQLLRNLSNGQRANVFIAANRLKWQENGAVGPKALLALTSGVNALGRVRMFAPNPRQPGSSVSHWDTALTPNELMEPFLNTGARDIITTEGMQDVGWQVNQQIQPCMEDATTGCLLNDRFRVTLFFDTVQGGGGAGRMGPGQVIPMSGIGVDQGLVIHFGNASNPELMVKMLNACNGPFNAFWVFYAATTNFGFTLTVEDTENGLIRNYPNTDLMPAAPVLDTMAFATCP